VQALGRADGRRAARPCNRAGWRGLAAGLRPARCPAPPGAGPATTWPSTEPTSASCCRSGGAGGQQRSGSGADSGDAALPCIHTAPAGLRPWAVAALRVSPLPPPSLPSSGCVWPAGVPSRWATCCPTWWLSPWKRSWGAQTDGCTRASLPPPPLCTAAARRRCRRRHDAAPAGRCWCAGTALVVSGGWAGAAGCLAGARRGSGRWALLATRGAGGAQLTPLPACSAAGGTAALVTMLLQQSGLPEGMGPVRCITLGTGGRRGRSPRCAAAYTPRGSRSCHPPPSPLLCHKCLLRLPWPAAAVMSRPLAEACEGLVTSVIVGSDVVPHLSLASVEALLLEASRSSPVRRTVEQWGSALAGALVRGGGGAAAGPRLTLRQPSLPSLASTPAAPRTPAAGQGRRRPAWRQLGRREVCVAAAEPVGGGRRPGPPHVAGQGAAGCGGGPGW
jgi:hypothetical protein